ncbi:MAG: hypothetical protein RXO36_06610 [Candidatus Nanopusillus acidilobi]
MFILRYLGINMKEITRAILLKVPIELDNEIIQYTKGKYRSRQEFILECIREKLKEGGN